MYYDTFSAVVAASQQLRADGNEPLPHVSLLTPQQIPPNRSKCVSILGFDNLFSTSVIV